MGVATAPQDLESVVVGLGLSSCMQPPPFTPPMDSLLGGPLEEEGGDWGIEQYRVGGEASFWVVFPAAPWARVGSASLSVLWLGAGAGVLGQTLCHPPPPPSSSSPPELPDVFRVCSEHANMPLAYLPWAKCVKE